MTSPAHLVIRLDVDKLNAAFAKVSAALERLRVEYPRSYRAAGLDPNHRREDPDRSAMHAAYDRRRRARRRRR